MISESKVPPGGADSEAHRVVRSPHDRVFSFLQGFFEPPRESDCTAVGISKGLGSTRCEAVMPVFGGKCDPRASFLCRPWRHFR